MLQQNTRMLWWYPDSLNDKKLIFVNIPIWSKNFSRMCISILYTFRATMCPSLTVSMRYLVYVTVCGRPSGRSSTHTVTYTRYRIVKCSLYRPGLAQRVGRGIALLVHDRGTRRGWVVSSTPRPHFTPGKESVPILQEAVWASGPVWTGGKSRPHRDSIPDCPARSQSLHRLSYPAHRYRIDIVNSSDDGHIVARNV